MATAKKETDSSGTPDGGGDVSFEGMERANGVLIRWVGHTEDHSQIRKISAADFKSVGVDDNMMTTCDTTDPMTRGQALVSVRAAEYLLEIEKGFELVPDGEIAFKFR